MRIRFLLPALFVLCAPVARAVDEEYKPGPDSLPQPGVPKGELIKDRYAAEERSVFPGTEREYTVYLPAGLDKTKPAPFMVFQDGVIYQAPTVFDNLIAKKQIPPLIGIFIKPGVVPAANDNALPRFNRSYEYDSVTDAYSRFLIEEFLPAIAQKHGIKLSEKGDDAAIAGNSSGGICAFMVGWHRPDRFRRVFTGVGTYVGIHGADQLYVLVRKTEPKPLRVYLQSGTHDNDLYCGDWWMANQTMERALAWSGYDVNHTWGEGGHNQKHATAIFPEALRWLWRGWPEEGLRANPANTSKWKGYEILPEGSRWEVAAETGGKTIGCLASNRAGDVAFGDISQGLVRLIGSDGKTRPLGTVGEGVSNLAYGPNDTLYVLAHDEVHGPGLFFLDASGKTDFAMRLKTRAGSLVVRHDNHVFISGDKGPQGPPLSDEPVTTPQNAIVETLQKGDYLCLSPDQTLLYSAVQKGVSALGNDAHRTVSSAILSPEGKLRDEQAYYLLEDDFGQIANGPMCVDADGRLYVGTAVGVQVCDQAGRVNFIIPTPEAPRAICLGGKDLSELFVACGDKIYKRALKAHGVVSGQMEPIKPKPPHL